MNEDMNGSGASAVSLIGDEKTRLGVVLFFSSRRGYGFLAWEIDGVKMRDIFVHFSDILSEGYKTLAKDQKVSFSVGVNKNGDPKAILVKVLT